ncbi:hypothetical protein C8R44DRAFT_648056, partial [Mycena epipterygia]
MPHRLGPRNPSKKTKLLLNPSVPQDIDQFPSELYDYIIDHLHDDRRTLSACSLVCRDWYATSSYHLF